MLLNYGLQGHPCKELEPQLALFPPHVFFSSSDLLGWEGFGLPFHESVSLVPLLGVFRALIHPFAAFWTLSPRSLGPQWRTVATQTCLTTPKPYPAKKKDSHPRLSCNISIWKFQLKFHGTLHDHARMIVCHAPYKACFAQTR